MQTRPRHRAGPAAALVAAAFVLVVTGQGAAVAQPAQPHVGDKGFSSSFEADQPQPDWRNTVEVGPDGHKRSSGIDGTINAGIPGNVTDHVVSLRASDENAGSGEGKGSLIDINPDTKWLAFHPTAWVEFDLDEAVKLTTYAMTSANDHAERDPKDWTLQGSTDGKDWKTLSTQQGQDFDKRLQTRSYEIAGADTAYAHYRLDITANHGAADAVQLADVQFSDGDTSTPPPSDMVTREDSGPTSSPTAKTGAGFTGTRSLRYEGTQKGTGRAYSYNKVFDVNTRISRNTELSYKLFPEMGKTDLNYPSTDVAVDLAFTDGTYLSDLKATDSNGGLLTPQGQGAAMRLYVNQWNAVSADIGTVAAGKTVDRILVAYDSPKGPATFRGWIDDISLAAKKAEKPSAHLSDYALTTRGTNSSGSFSRGNNFPATAVPNGFNFWTPVTDAGSTSWLYNYASGNNADNLPTLQAFSASHEPSPWMGDRQTFQVMPSVASGTPDASRTKRALPFKHENEVAKPDYYGVTFENGLKAEMTPTDHAAMMRFTYPGDNASMIFDNISNDGGLTLDPRTGTFSGYSDVKSGGSTGATRMFVYGVADTPVTASSKLTGGGGDNVTGYMRFKPGKNRTVTLRMATSLIGVAQAKSNLAQELPASSTFAGTEAKARSQWDKILGKIEVQGATHDQLTSLYSSLYRLYLYPNSGSEKVGSKTKYASPFSAKAGDNTPTHTGAKVVDGSVYVNNGFWDTYRTTWPAYSFLTPKKAGKLVDGFVQQYKDGGWISRWSSPGYSDLMTGTSSDVAFADAYVKGVKFDAKAAYEAALKNATVVPPSSGVGRKGMDTSPFTGYASTATNEGMSWSMEGYVNDYGIAQMGKALYKKTHEARYKEESEYFLNRAQNYVKLFDPEVGFFQGRTPDGGWRLPADKYDPRVWGYDYTETDGWGYAFTAPQDSRGLANLYGGQAGLAKKLDTYFSTPETAGPEYTGSYGGVIHEMTEARDVRMGQYGHSNQVAHHVTYMYDAAGQPWKAQEKIREVLGRLYTGSDIGQGYHGDEDNGEQSAWYIFSSLGFYPLVMGSGEFAVGSPQFTKATVHLDNGRDLVVKAPQNSTENIYVQGLKVNGKAWNSTALPNDVLQHGGTLDFAMGPRPSKWGTGKKAAPVSIAKDDKVPSPREDATSGTGALFDNTSKTDASFTSAGLPVKSATRAVQYTLTSSDKAKAPTGWKLEGSADGTKWTTLDKRSGESFAYDKQTRVFSVDHPGTYKQYRLVSTGTATLAEVELLS